MPASEINYEVSLESLHAHNYKVSCSFQTTPNAEVKMSLPSWTPGSYLIREFAQHVLEVKAICDGQDVLVAKKDKDTWALLPLGKDVRVEYLVYAFDPSIRAAFLDDSYAFFSGTSIFMRIHGAEHISHRLTVNKPTQPSAQNFKLTTSMPASKVGKAGFGSYVSKNYDELVDHPVLMSDFLNSTFDVSQTKHHLVVTPKIDFDIERLEKDCKKICQEHVDLFGGSPSFDSYHFLIRVEQDGYGGLEHRSSSALLCKLEDLPLVGQKTPPESYRDLLGLISHEYFHAWNIKRLKPSAFKSFDYNAENYTDLLWFFEGFTSYYDDLAVCRSKTITVENYLETLSDTISNVYSQNGRFAQTLSEASFDAWIKFYRPNENSPNAHVSYYKKGSLFALALDLKIRAHSDQKHSLDDVMRSLWIKYGANEKGLTESSIIAEINSLTNSDFSSFFQDHIHSTKDIELSDLLLGFGVELDWNNTDEKPYLGCSFKGGSDCIVKSVFHNSPAITAGIYAGDNIIAINNYQVDSDNFETQLARHKPGDTVKIHLFRRGTLRNVDAQLSELPPNKCTLKVLQQPNESQMKALASWLKTGY